MSERHILIVAHDALLRESRQALLRSAGYEVTSVDSDELAITAVDKERFDLVVIGRTSRLSKAALDRRLRERHPDIRVLKIVTAEEPYSLFASRTTDAKPRHVLTAVGEMLFARIAPKSFLQ
jgi:DNA-binding NtrC family response regulator